MTESLGITVHNTCYECMVIERDKQLDDSKPCYECEVLAQDKAKGFPVGPCHTCADKAMLRATDYQAGKCPTCLKNDEARDDDKAHNLHEDDRLHEDGKVMSYDTSDEPSASDWVTSQTYIRKRGWIVKFTEIWDEDNPFRLVELSVKFLETDEPLIRHEFLPPIAQLVDGGVYEELWELEDYAQAKRETECRWCHILTPKLFNDCQSCDRPLENNLI